MLLNPTEHQTFNAAQQFAFHRLSAEFGVTENATRWASTCYSIHGGLIPRNGLTNGFALGYFTAFNIWFNGHHLVGIQWIITPTSRLIGPYLSLVILGPTLQWAGTSYVVSSPEMHNFLEFTLW